MTTDDIIRMAREIDLLTTTEPDGYQFWIPENLERFAALVAAAEREACAKVCDDLPLPPYVSNNDAHIWDVTCVDCAEAIRARGQS
jgi:hypothetical protein